MTESAAIGVDIGGGSTKIGRIAADGRLLDSVRIVLPVGADFPAIVAEYQTAIAAPGPAGHRLPVGIAYPGHIDRTRGVGIHSNVAAEHAALGTVSAAAACRAALAGDEATLGLFAAMADWLGMAVATWRATLHPDLVVFGGGLSVLGQPFIDQIRGRADARSLPFLSAGCRLTLARLGNDAGMIGAGLAALAY